MQQIAAAVMYLTLTCALVSAQTTITVSGTSLTPGAPIGVGQGGALQSSPLYIDGLAYRLSSNCTVGTNDDGCLAAAIAAIPAGGAAIIDMSGYGSSLAFNANPFAALIVTSSGPVGSTSKCGVVRFNSGQTITTNSPIVVPACWRIENYPYRAGASAGGGSTVWKPGSAYPKCYGSTLVCASGGTVSTAAESNSPSNCGSPCTVVATPSSALPSNVLFSHFAVCQSSGAAGGACSPTAGANLVWGIIIAVNSATACGSATNCLLIEVPAQGSNQSPPPSTTNTNVNYVIWAPMVTLGDMNASGGSFGIQWEGGEVQTGNTANIGAGGAAPVCFANYNAQEESWISDTQCQIGGTGVAIGMDIEGAAFNSGPYENDIITATSNCGAGAILLVSRVAIATAYPRQWANSTLTGSSCAGGKGVTTVVDWETPSKLEHIHIENCTSGSCTATETFVHINDGANVSCPVICVMPSTPAQMAEVDDVNTTTTGTNTTLANIGTTTGGFAIEVGHIRASGGNLFKDLNTSCVIQASSESILGRYISGTSVGNTVAPIGPTYSTSNVCPASTTPTYAELTTSVGSITSSGFTSLTDTASPNTHSLAWNLAKNGSYHLTCHVVWQASAAATTPIYRVTGPASPTAVTVGLAPQPGASSPPSVVTAFSTSIANGSPTIAATTNYMDTLYVGIVNGSNAGTALVQMEASGTGTITVEPGTYCE